MKMKTKRNETKAKQNARRAGKFPKKKKEKGRDPEEKAWKKKTQFEALNCIWRVFNLQLPSHNYKNVAHTPCVRWSILSAAAAPRSRGKPFRALEILHIRRLGRSCGAIVSREMFMKIAALKAMQGNEILLT